MRIVSRPPWYNTRLILSRSLLVKSNFLNLKFFFSHPHFNQTQLKNCLASSVSTSLASSVSTTSSTSSEAVESDLFTTLIFLTDCGRGGEKARSGGSKTTAN